MRKSSKERHTVLHKRKEMEAPATHNKPSQQHRPSVRLWGLDEVRVDWFLGQLGFHRTFTGCCLLLWLWCYSRSTVNDCRQLTISWVKYPHAAHRFVLNKKPGVRPWGHAFVKSHGWVAWFHRRPQVKKSGYGNRQVEQVSTVIFVRKNKRWVMSMINLQ